MPGRVFRRGIRYLSKGRNYNAAKLALAAVGTQLATGSGSSKGTKKKTSRRIRYGGSFTITKRKKRKNARMFANEGVMSTSTVYTSRKKPLIGKHWNVSPESTLENAISISISSTTSGTQPGANQLNRQTVTTLGPYGIGVGLTQLFQQSFASNAQYDVLDPTVASYSYSGKMLYKGISGSYEISNCEKTNTIVKIYMCISKSNAVTYVSPSAVWEEGLDETAGITGASFANSHMPNAHPNTSKKFRDNWRIVRSSTFNMTPGQTQKHFFRHTSNAVVDVSNLAEYNNLKGITIAFLVVSRGTPVDVDVAQTHAAAVNIVYSPVKLIGIAVTKYRFANITGLPPVHLQNNSLYSAAPLNIWEVNDESGVVVDIFPVTEAA